MRIRIIAYFLLILFAFQTFGAGLLLHALIRSHRSEIYTSNLSAEFYLELEEQELAALTWVNDHEILIGQKRFDIVSSKPSGNKILLGLISDEKENRLHAALKEHDDSNTGSSKNNVKKQSVDDYTGCDQSCLTLPVTQRLICFPLPSRRPEFIAPVHVPPPQSV